MNLHLDDRTCPACGSGALRRFTARAADIPDASETSLSLHECSSCGLAWQHPPARSAQDSATFFGDAYGAAKTGTYFDSEKRRAVSELQAGVVSAFLPEPDTLLDVGAGDGAFIRVAAGRGWRCTGIDPAAPATPPDPQSRVRLVRGDFDALPREARFRAVTAWDVVEHVERPDALLAGAAARLDEHGMLFVETGNFQSGDRIEGGANWWCYQADHRWYFAPPTLVAVLKAIGLVHIVLLPRVLRPAWNGARGYVAPRLYRTVRSMVRHPGAANGALRRHVALRNASNAWPDWSGLAIFTLIASRAPIAHPAEPVIRMSGA